MYYSDLDGLFAVVGLLGLVVGLIIIALLGVWANSIAKKKQRSQVAWVLATVIASVFSIWPALIVILILYLVPAAGENKVCPQCGERVKQVARVCRYCRYEFKDIG